MNRILTCLFLAATVLAHAVGPAIPPTPPTLDESFKGAAFTAIANGTMPMTYQWFRTTVSSNAVSAFVSPVKIPIPAPEGIQPTLILKEPYVSGLYYCEITNVAGTVTSKTFQLSVTRVPSAPDMSVTVRQP